MRDARGRFTPGNSGNAKGRPRKGFTFGDELDKALQKKHRGRIKRGLVLDKLVDLAIDGDVKAIRVICSLQFDRYQLELKTEIMDRIEALEAYIESTNKTN